MTSTDIIAKEFEEKLRVREFFGNKKKGFFIEVGANEPDPVFSQSMHLENELSWNGILVEPIDYLAEKQREVRPSCKVVEFACTKSNDSSVAELHIPISENGDISGHASLEINIDHSSTNKTRKLKVKTTTLDNIIQTHANGKHIDLLTVDVEGTELDVLIGANLKVHQPTLIIIEDRLVFIGKHLFLKKHGYKFFRRTGFEKISAKAS
jgi:FkbM family methyltransferase